MKCGALMSRDPIVGTLSECPHCGAVDVEIRKEDVGIGSYEFWGQKCHDVRWACFCTNCDEEVEFNLDYDGPEEEPYEDPVQADADVLKSAGMGTDEDYGYFGEDDGY